MFRWFVGLNLDEAVWDVTIENPSNYPGITLSNLPNELLEGSVAREFLAQVVARAREAGLVSDEHFTVDGTLLEA